MLTLFVVNCVPVYNYHQFIPSLHATYMHTFSELLPTQNQESFKKNYIRGWEMIANKGLLLMNKKS
jgi:hypothetical protein